MNKRRITGGTLTVYLLGSLILALGVSLNTKTLLGVSPVTSVAYNVTQISGLAFGLVMFIYYCLLIFLQFLLLRRDFERLQFLQLFASLLLSVFLQFFDNLLSVPDQLGLRLAALLAGIVLTGLGASLTVAMQVSPNPADALAHTIGRVLDKSFGYGKNLLDAVCISLSLALGLIFKQSPLGIGPGTVVAMLLTGRVIALCHPWSERIYQRLSSPRQP